MLALILVLMFTFLILGFPMLISMIISPLIILLIYFPNIDPSLITQHLITGVSPMSLVAVPMFIFAADIMCQGQIANRLINFVKSLVSNLHGGLAITAAGTCAIFGAISGSTQATLVAVGKPLYKDMLNEGYNKPHVLALLMSSANIALLIPPSIVMIMYAVITGTSVGELFIAGVGPGLAVFAAFSIYEFLKAKHKGIGKRRKFSFSERIQSLKKAILPLGFPVIILGGIYSGLFSPTESAAMSILYATVLEVFLYKSINFKDIGKIALSTGLITATVFILIAGGQVFSWVITYANIPQTLSRVLLGPNPSQLKILFLVVLFFYVGCMFVDSIPVIVILTPIFFKPAMEAGIDPVHLGIVITLQAAIGAVSPPFGCNLFTASAIFNEPYETVVKGLLPYTIMYLAIAIALNFFPGMALFLRDLIYA